MSEYGVSVVVPMFNEKENIEPLVRRLQESLDKCKDGFEVILVNDGSTDGSEEVLEEVHRDHKNITVVNLYRNEGKAAALEVGMGLTRGDYIAIMDGDLQYSSDDIMPMIDELKRGYDVVSGKRLKRGDVRSIVVTSRIFNAIVRAITGLKFTDYFSGLKCFNRDVITYMSLYGDLYRFASVYAFRQGFRVTEVPIDHHHRVSGSSSYNMVKRCGMAFMDILTVLFTITFSRDRTYYVGLAGASLLSIGITVLYATIGLSRDQTSVLHSTMGQVGIVLGFLGSQMLILQKVSNDFFDRHQERYLERKRNLRSVLRYESDARKDIS